MQSFFTAIRGGCALLGGLLGALLGEWNGLLTALLVFMATDYLTGVLAAIAEKKLSSAVGFRGLARKMLILLLVIIGNVVDVYVISAGAAVRGIVIAFYLTNEGLSVLENAGRLGVPYPEKLRDILAQLKAQ